MDEIERSELERLDPESDACFVSLAALVAEELSARIAVRDDPSTADGRRVISECIADAILDGFVVRPRTSPRYRWKSGVS